ncbi:MAG: hypothetical protein JOZ39_04525 [Chloroflexi bacterium]|nr:hypothetical protein [Chloroflexota bacterium]
MSMKDLAELAQKMNESIDVTDEEEVKKYLTGFQNIGENFVGIRRRKITDPTNKTYQIGPKGVIESQQDLVGMSVIYSGTPHHTRGMFGYWHINDVDEIYFRLPNQTHEDITVCILMRRPKPGERDMFAWYCQKCSTLLHCFVFPSGDRGATIQNIWEAEATAVTEFNADPKNRRCVNCGTEHPLGYRFYAPLNTPEEEAARSIW